MITTSIDFPTGLPLPQQANYGVNHVSPFLRTDMATGRAKQRRMFTSVPSLVDVEWKLSQPQTQIFEAWFKYTANDGADWFNCEVKTPMGTKEYVCRFTEMYEGPILFAVRRWIIRARLEIFERPLFDEDWYTYALEYIRYSDIFDLAMNQEWPAP